MIIWLASYPKSGNTWVRLFLNSLFFSNNGKLNINDIKDINHINIGQFPERRYFNNLVDDLDDIKKISKNWIIAQNIINLDKKIKFFKTHHAFCNINNNYFTDINNTMAVIYIVRDPRNIVTSLLNHYERENYTQVLDFIFNEDQAIGKPNFKKVSYKQSEIFTLIGSWKNNYNSWKNFPKNFYLIKYEDLIENPLIEFNKLTDFLANLLKIKFNKDKINNSINSCDFKNLKLIEKKYGFVESILSKKTGKKINFFNLGPDNNWKKILDNEITKKIEKNFGKEMKELRYI